MLEKFKTKYVTVGVCKHKDKYLLLRLAYDYPACPGDWDFVISRIYNPDISDEDNILSNVLKHTGLKGKIIKKGNVYIWPDDESKINWIIWPCIVGVNSYSINLSKKFVEPTWIRKKEVLKYDRKEYLTNVFKNVGIII